MHISDTPIEDILKELLQRDLIFTINKKKIKQGKLLLFKQNNYTIDFQLCPVNKKDFSKIITYNTPIPFNLTINEKGMVFDYRLNTLSKNNKNILKHLKSIIPVAKNKFYDNILYIDYYEI